MLRRALEHTAVKRDESVGDSEQGVPEGGDFYGVIYLPHHHPPFGLRRVSLRNKCYQGDVECDHVQRPDGDAGIILGTWFEWHDSPWASIGLVTRQSFSELLSKI